MPRLSVIALVLLAATPAFADAQAEADLLTREAIARARAGDREGAIVRFKAAQRLDPRPNNDCNIGLAFAQLERWARAHLYLERCRRQVKAGLPDWVDKRLKQSTDGLHASLHVPIEVVTEPAGAHVTASTLDPDEWVITPATVWLPLGERELTISLDGYRPVKRALKLDEVRPRTVQVMLESSAPVASPAPAPAVVAPTVSPPAATPELVAAPPRDNRPARLRAIGGATLGIGLLALVNSLTLYLVARDVTTPEADALPRHSSAFNSVLDRFHGEYYSSIALLAVGSAATVAGVLVLGFSAKKRR